ncbi:MAG: hypothetical protein Q7T56_08750 [Nocardioidaceae bacterium]|nr:hypothetical protein [Nocardioidaceae bacterium]
MTSIRVPTVPGLMPTADVRAVELARSAPSPGSNVRLQLGAAKCVNLTELVSFVHWLEAAGVVVVEGNDDALVAEVESALGRGPA